MGNMLSGVPTGNAATTRNNNSGSESETMEDVTCLHENDDSVIEEQFHDTVSDDEDTRAKLKEEEMNEFKKQLSLKREQRREILSRHRSEKKELESALQDERESKIELCEKNQLLRELLIKNNIEIPENLQADVEKSYIADSISLMREEVEKLRSSNIKLRCELASSNSALQNAYSDIEELSAKNTESIKQVSALKEVITVSKTMINLRETQLNELKDKLGEIEQSLADRETNLLSTDLRQEYERQLQNIRTLRSLYEERARLADVSRQALSRDLDEHKVLLETEINKSKDLTRKIEELEAKISDLEETVQDKNTTISTNKEENRGLKAEMLGINKLFSQVLLGYKNKQDLDKLVHRLEENHGLLTQMAERENGSEVSSELPKLLLEIVSQIDEKDNIDTNAVFDKTIAQKDLEKQDVSSAEEIVQNLPKVWRVLMELLSHQSEAETNNTEKVTTCYKSVETKSGPVLVPSVSQTYIRLKDLILEKLTLIKEVNRMKQLNTHLESRLGEQERRLCSVTSELSKTWHVVGRLRRHHHQLHTHEKILKYELQQKRKLLNELKEELEYCREKWEQAREKNTQSEKDWRKLRTEFSNRKLKPELSSINNSAESGYSDERPSEDSESNDESEYVEPKIKFKKKLKKSFETAVDSSTDFNLAEREDPVSDMVDIAELPLDSHENVECVSDSCKCKTLTSLLKNENSEETEDEVGDMGNDSCLEEISITENLSNVTEIDKGNLFNGDNTQRICETPGTSTDVTLTTASDSISKNAMEQNERPSFNDKNPDVPKTDQTTQLGKDQTDSTVEQISSETELQRIVNVTDSTAHKENTVNFDESFASAESTTSKPTNVETERNTHTPVTDNTEQISEVDFKNILENIRKQNERLQIKDKRLENLESGCSSVMANISSTLKTGEIIISKLDTLHLKHAECPTQIEESSQEANSNPDKPQDDSEEPSSSLDLDHEARFAARDLRLKRLEEQTKSLVNRVNKTASKGVKIHYKLEELHNIYGSENSRSGTPSEDTEDISQNDDNEDEDDEQN